MEFISNAGLGDGKPGFEFQPGRLFALKSVFVCLFWDSGRMPGRNFFNNSGLHCISLLCAVVLILKLIDFGRPRLSSPWLPYWSAPVVSFSPFSILPGFKTHLWPPSISWFSSLCLSKPFSPTISFPPSSLSPPLSLYTTSNPSSAFLPSSA